MQPLSVLQLRGKQAGTGGTNSFQLDSQLDFAQDFIVPHLEHGTSLSLADRFDMDVGPGQHLPNNDGGRKRPHTEPV